MQARRGHTTTPVIRAVGTAVPTQRYTQFQLLEMGGRSRLRDAFFLHSDIDTRHLYFPPDFQGDETIDEMQERARHGALELGSEAIHSCLRKADLDPQEVGFLSTATCTVSLCPQLDAWFIGTVPFRSDTQRAHIGDTGCAAAMVALQCAANFLYAHPNSLAVAAAVEICSAALYRDGTPEAALGEAIFADGAGAVCLAGEGPGFEIVGYRSLIRAEHIGLTGFDFPQGRRRLVLKKELPAVASEVLYELAGSLLEEHSLRKEEIRFWILHSAGRKVLDLAAARLGLSQEALRHSRHIFRTYGNMSSATVLFVLEHVITGGEPLPGDFAFMAAMGAGFSAEGALLRWVE